MRGLGGLSGAMRKDGRLVFMSRPTSGGTNKTIGVGEEIRVHNVN